MDYLPRSSSNFLVNGLSVVFFFSTVYAGHRFLAGLSWESLVFLALLVAVIPLILRDYFVNGRAAMRKLNPAHSHNRLIRVLTKLIALYGTFLLVLFCYLVVPIYWVSPKAVYFYAPFFHWINQAGGGFLIVCAGYFWLVDRVQENPYDEYWQVGQFFLGRFRVCQKEVLLEYVKSWFIKAFFLPFMLGFLIRYMQNILLWNATGDIFLSLFNHWLDIFYAIDVLFGVLGYFWAMKFLNSHIQSTEPTLLGWWACLACYNPFYSIVGLGLLPSQTELPWDVWLGFYPTLYYFWAGVILFLSVIYMLATVAFGYRMSNLTYRGIITSGPYRYTKHPAYICKVLSWWMIAMPFYSTLGIRGALIQTLSMAAISVVYYVRAKTEENHLSNYPEYVDYAKWINEHGLFARLGKMFPVLQYSYQRALKSKSVVWFKKARS